MTTFDMGRQAEAAVAEYLRCEQFEILAQTWRTRSCEVKYRRSNLQGAGLDYITSRKVSQMHFAAEQWVCKNDWRGEYQLAAAEVSDVDFTVDNFIDSIF